MKSYYLQIPIAEIKPNPQQPRRVITREMVERKKASLKADGLLTPVKLRPLTAEERTADTDPLYFILGGELRYQAALELGWKTLDALVIGGATPEEAELISIMDNKGEEMHWLDWYQAIEKRLNHPQKPTQQQVADELGVSQQEVSRAVATLAFLNQASRELIYSQCVKSGADSVTQKMAYQLSFLKDPRKIEEAIPVVIALEMTESEVQKLVSWIQKGNSPESFGEKVSNGPVQDPTDPFASLWKDLPANVRVIMGKTGYELRLKMAPSEAPTTVYSALAAIEHLKETALMPDSPPANPRFAQALPDLATEGRRMKAIEQGQQIAQAEEKRKATEAKDQLKAQKAAAKEQAKTLRAETAENKAQKEAQKREEFETFKRATQNHLETTFGTGPLVEGISQKALSGQKAHAIKAVKSNLSFMGKSPEEQKVYLKDFKLRLQRLSKLNPEKPIAVKTPKPAKPNPTNDPVGPNPPLESAKPNPAANPSSGLAQPNRANDLVGHSQAHTPGLFDLVKGAVEKVTESVESGSVLGTAANMVLKNAKQTVNYEERKEMRHLFNEM